MTRLLVLPGDGIGPEITAATIAVVRAATGESVTFDVRTTAVKTGTATLSVQVTSDGQRTPVTDDETTQILSKQ